MPQEVQEGGEALNYSQDPLLDPYFNQQQQQGMGYAPMPRRMDSEFLKLYDVEDVLNQIENFLRGKHKDDNGAWVPAYAPLATQEGINLLMGDIRFHLHKIVFLSNLSKEDVLRIALEARKMSIRWIYLNWFRFEIDKSNMDRIIYNVDHIVFCSLMKPLNDKERSHLGQTTTRSENIMVSQQQGGGKKWGLI